VPCSASEHRQNRRTEITITYIDNPASIPDYLQQKAQEGRQGESLTSTQPPQQRKPGPESIEAAQSGNRYWVVAGTFRENSNALNRLRQLEALGYRDAQVLTFSGESSHAVVVGKFGALAEAAQFSRALKEAHEIGAYVRKIK
jgi:cell division protein FtsN